MKRKPLSQRSTDDPQELGKVLSQLFQLRGLARPRVNRDLQEAWELCAGVETARQTKVLNYRGGVLKVAVRSSALLGELSAFRKEEILREFAQQAGRLRVRELKFQLRTDLPIRE